MAFSHYIELTMQKCQICLSRRLFIQNPSIYPFNYVRYVVRKSLMTHTSILGRDTNFRYQCDSFETQGIS